MSRVLVLGVNGMLGSMVFDYLSSRDGYCVIGTVSSHDKICDTENILGRFGSIVKMDATTPTDIDGLIQNGAFEYVINCVGVIKPNINESSRESIVNAIYINSVFPHDLASAVEGTQTRVIQIATDCVYSGRKEPRHGDPHDPTDIYGKTKTLGEVMWCDNFKNIRCSIIGPEILSRQYSLIENITQKAVNGEKIAGYTNHTWNGVTTLAFAKVCDGLMRSKEFDSLNAVEHLTSSTEVSKASLVRLILALGGNLGASFSRTASMDNARLMSIPATDKTKNLWKLGGYDQAPSIYELMIELAKYLERTTAFNMNFAPADQ